MRGPPASHPSASSGRDAIALLGCRVWLDGEGRLAGVLAARVRTAAETYARQGGEAAVVASGGRRWPDGVEADVMAAELARLGVPERAIVRERCSLSTRDNARFVAAILGRRGIGRAKVVTSGWHLPRAVALFRAEGIEVEGVPAPGGEGSPARWLWRWGREQVLTWVQQAR